MQLSSPELTSIYRWQGEVERAAEVLLVIKTRRASRRALIARLSELHSYDVPEAIVLPITAGRAPYVAWLLGETAAAASHHAGAARAFARLVS